MKSIRSFLGLFLVLCSSLSLLEASSLFKVLFNRNDQNDDVIFENSHLMTRLIRADDYETDLQGIPLVQRNRQITNFDVSTRLDQALDTDEMRSLCLSNSSGKTFTSLDVNSPAANIL